MDRGGCGSDPSFANPNYIGPAGQNYASLSVQAVDRSSFSLLEFDLLCCNGTALLSSNGGLIDWGFPVDNSNFGHKTFSGPEWTNITWFMLVKYTSGETPSTIDNITINIPEPGTGLLIATALAALCSTRLRRASLRRDRSLGRPSH